MWLENDEGLPWTAATGVGWIVLLVAVTSGVAWLALSIYLAVWIWNKRKGGISLYLYLTAGAAIALYLLLESLRTGVTITDAVETMASGVFLAANLALRYEIRRYYQNAEGWEPELSIFMTLFFGAIYINYCLNRFDWPDTSLISHFNQRTEPISMDLGTPTKPITSAKILE